MDDPLSIGLSGSVSVKGDALSIVLIVVIVILVFFSAFFSASETAFTSLNVLRIKTQLPKKRAKLVINLYEKYERLISTILVGNNIVNICATTLSTVLFTKYFGNDLGATLSTAVLTITILIFGEVTPKSLAKEAPDKIAMLVVYPLTAIYYVLTPFNFVFNLISKGIKKLFHVKGKKATYTEEEFKMLVSDIADQGVLKEHEEEFIQNTITGDDRTVESVMTKIEDVEYIKSSEKIENILESFETYNYSRLPVKREEKFIGVLYQKDFYEALLKGDKEWKSLIRPVRYVKPTEKIFRLLHFMQKQHQHMAIVVDEDKLPLGIITLEDIIEEIVGEIEDEYDDEREEADELEELKKQPEKA